VTSRSDHADTIRQGFGLATPRAMKRALGAIALWEIEHDSLVADIQRMREEIAALRRGYAREELAAIDRKLASAREQRPNIEAPLVVWEYAFSLESRIEALVADNQRLREACP